MDKQKKGALVLAALLLVCILALGTTGFMLIGNWFGQGKVLSYLYNFLFIFTPCLGVSVIIEIVKIKR